MNRRKLVLKISREAKRVGLHKVTISPGGTHDQLRIGGKKISLPRHNEIPEGTSESIMKECEEFFGKGWWRK